MDLQVRFKRLDKTIAASEIVVGQQTVQPIVKLIGGQIWEQNGHFASAMGRLTPHTIRVQEGSQVYTVPITDPLREAVRGMIIAALAVSGFCLAIMLVAGRLARQA